MEAISSVVASEATVDPPVDSEAVGTNVSTAADGPKVDPADERVKPDGGLVLHSRRTERLRKRQLKRQSRPLPELRTILDLPYELLMDILSRVYPSDLVRLSRANRSIHDFIAQEELTLAKHIIRWRYPCMEK